MTGFQNTDYGTRTNQSHYQPVSQANHAGSTAKAPQSSFSQKLTANLKMGYLYGNVDMVTGQELYINYDESSSEEDPVILAEGSELERYLFFQTAGKRQTVTEKEHVLFEKEEPKTGIFSNKTLAEAAGFKLDSEIDWESEGTGTLTEEQIQYLKGKYNVEDMSQEDYYRLLTELSKMNVLSGDEVKSQFLRQAPPCTSMITPVFESRFDRQSLAGNYLRKLQDETDYTEFILEMIRQGKCSVGPENALGAVRRFYEKQQEYNQKIGEILKQLKREDSNTDASYENRKPD